MALNDVAPPLGPPFWVHPIVAVIVIDVCRVGLVLQRLQHALLHHIPQSTFCMLLNHAEFTVLQDEHSMEHLAAPVAQYYGGSDLGGCPAGALIMGDEPDVIPASCPVPIGQLRLKPPLCLQQHRCCMHHTWPCQVVGISDTPPMQSFVS